MWKLCDQMMEVEETITQTVAKAIMEFIVHITAKDTGDNPPPKKKQRQMRWIVLFQLEVQATI